MTEIMLIGEAMSDEDQAAGRPFQGAPGWLLKKMLAQVGIDMAQCYQTNVFNFPCKDVKTLCGSKADGVLNKPALTKGAYLNRGYAKELTRLDQEIEHVNPNLIVALGTTAIWAVLNTTGIKATRGSAILTSGYSRPFKVLPTYHPSAVLRDWTLRPIVLSDFDKARRYSGTRDFIRPERFVWLQPTLADLERYNSEYVEGASRLSIDIETKGDQVTCIGFAPSETSAIVVPFYSAAQPDGNYWRTKAEEMEAWGWVRKWCAYPAVYQNGLYDLHRLWRTYGIKCNTIGDTMLLHHALQPEMEKSLGFLASCYTDEASWKFMAKHSGTLKQGDD